MIAQNRLRALKQRISSHFHLEPLTLKETLDYVRYRLKVAGCDRPLFDPSALKKIFELTNGYPRLINILGDLCLVTAYAKGLHEIDPVLVKESAAELMHPSQLTEKNHSTSEKKPKFDNALNADTQRSAASKTLPLVTNQTTKQLALPERQKPSALLLPTFLRKPAFLFAVVALLPILVWFNLKDDQGRQESSLSQKFHQENQTKADVKLIQSTTTNKHVGEPQTEHVQIEEPAVSAYKIPTEPQLINTAAVPPEEFASPMVVPPTARSEGFATPASKFSQDAQAVESPAEDNSEDVAQPENPLSQESSLSTRHDSPLKSTAENKANRSVDQSPSDITAQHNLSNLNPLLEERPIHTDPTTHMKKTNKLPSPNLTPDDIAASDEKMGGVNIFSNARPLSTRVPSTEKGGTVAVATEVTSTLPATASTPVEGSSEIKSDQATKSAFVDVPSQSASENNPSAIIDFVIRKRSRQLGNQGPLKHRSLFS